MFIPIQNIIFDQPGIFQIHFILFLCFVLSAYLRRLSILN